MTMGSTGKNGVRMSDKQECQEILDTFFKYGSELDTARIYGEGTTEQVCNGISVLLAPFDFGNSSCQSSISGMLPSILSTVSTHKIPP